LVDHSNRTSVDHFDQAVRQVAVGASVVVDLKEKPKVTVAEAIEPATDIAGVAEAVVLGGIPEGGGYMLGGGGCIPAGGG